MSSMNELAEALIRGDMKTVTALTQDAIDNGVAAETILNDGLIAGMDTVGQRFRANEVYVPEVLIAARAMKAGMALLQPELVKAGVKPIGTVVLGTVKGDLHDIGKNLVGMMMTGAGLRVVDAGTDVAAEKFIELARAENAGIIAMSALLTTTMSNMQEVVAAVKAAGLSVKTMIGGAPVTESFAEEIGADGYSADAASAADLARQLVAG